jgi:sulfate transport system ATP-binding protein
LTGIFRIIRIQNKTGFQDKSKAFPPAHPVYSIELPECREADGSAVVAYVRPYDIEINNTRQGSYEIEAAVLHIQGAGSVARFELERLDTLEIIQAELTKERYRELGLQTGDRVFIKPRNMRVFVQDYSI